MINRLQKIFVDRDQLNQSFNEGEPTISTVDFYNVDHNGRNLLHRAALQQNPKLLSEILTEYSKQQTPMHTYINTTDLFGITAVQMCCFANFNERCQCLKLFLEDGDLNSCNPRTLWAPVHWVAFYGDVDSMRLLIDREVILFKPDYEGYYPLDLAGRNNRKIVAQQIIEWLLQFIIDYEKSRVSTRVKNLVYDRFCEYDRYISNPALRLSLFYWACHFNLPNLDRFSLLNRFYPLGIYLDNTPLHSAIRSQNMEAFVYLLQSTTVKPFTQGMLLSRNATPRNNRIFSFTVQELQIYKRKYQQYIVKLDHWEYDYLNNKIPLLDQVDSFGNAPLHLAALSNNVDMITQLIQFGCLIDAQNGEFWRPADLAGTPEAASIFIQNEKSINQVLQNIRQFILTCNLPTKKYDPQAKRNLYLCQAVKDIENDIDSQQLCNISQSLITPDYILKCSSASLFKLNFQIQLLINAKFEVHLSRSLLDDTYYIMLISPVGELQMQAMIQKVQVKLLGSYDYEPYDTRSEFEPFRSLQRQSIIEEHLNKVLNIEELKQQKVILDTYRMHSYGGTSKIRRQWLNTWLQPFTQLSDYFKESQNQDFQSCTILRLYFGEKLAFFFAFKSYLTCFMIFAALPGLLLQLYVLAFNDFNSLLLPIYAIYMTIWSTITVEFWKRKQCEMNARWGLLDQMNSEEFTPRLEFSGDEYMNHITHEVEKYEHKGHTILVFLISFPILVLFSSIIVGVFVGIDYVQSKFASSSEYKMVVGIVQGVCISILNLLYTALVHYFVEKENHKFEQHYESSLIYKNVLFKFVNSYIAVFYTAFVRIDSSYQEIFYILVPVLVIKQLSYLVAALMIPQSLYKYKEKQYFKVVGKEQFKQTYQDSIDNLWKASTHVPLNSQTRSILNVTNSRIQANIDMDAVELNGLKLQAYRHLMTNYFMETMIDFGFITLFSAAFPIGPAIAIVINMIEIRMKIYSFNSVYRRPLAQRVAGIGDWMYIWEFLSFVGVFSNYALVFLKQGDQINEFFGGDFTRTNMLWLFLLFVFLNILLKYLIQWIIPDKPKWVQEWEEDLRNKKKQHSELKQKEDECHQLQVRVAKLEKQNNKLITRLEQEHSSLVDQTHIQQVELSSNTSETYYYKMERDLTLTKMDLMLKFIQQKKILLLLCAECQLNEAILYCQECKIQYCKVCVLDICRKHRISGIPDKGCFKMLYFSLPIVQTRSLKHLFDALTTYYEGKASGTQLFIEFEEFNLDDKFLVNRLFHYLIKRDRLTWNEFFKLVQQMVRGTFEQRLLLFFDHLEEYSGLEFASLFFAVQDAQFRRLQLALPPQEQTKQETIRSLINVGHHSEHVREYLNALLQI